MDNDQLTPTKHEIVKRILEIETVENLAEHQKFSDARKSSATSERVGSGAFFLHVLLFIDPGTLKHKLRSILLCFKLLAIIFYAHLLKKHRLHEYPHWSMISIPVVLQRFKASNCFIDGREFERRIKSALEISSTYVTSVSFSLTLLSDYKSKSHLINANNNEFNK
ncbi:hypothetical protein DINM_005984 [Dirofilaria immitis]|nr:hypothetical protein [Dirofilaria immitis]